MATSVCDRTPWGLRRLLRRHTGQTGIVIYGWFNRLRGWTPAGSWDAVIVRLDGDIAIAGRRRLVLDPLDRGPHWVSAAPGEHAVEFLAGSEVVRSERVTVGSGVVLIALRPPRRRGNRAPIWCIRRLHTER